MKYLAQPFPHPVLCPVGIVTFLSVSSLSEVATKSFLNIYTLVLLLNCDILKAHLFIFLII